MCVAVGYSMDLQQSKARAIEAKNGVDLTYVIPKEGLAASSTCWLFRPMRRTWKRPTCS